MCWYTTKLFASNKHFNDIIIISSRAPYALDLYIKYYNIRNIIKYKASESSRFPSTNMHDDYFNNNFSGPSSIFAKFV